MEAALRPIQTKEKQRENGMTYTSCKKTTKRRFASGRGRMTNCIVFAMVAASVPTHLCGQTTASWVFTATTITTSPSSAYVGIGTTSPVGLLQVGDGTASPGWALNVTPKGGTPSQTAFFQDTTVSTGKTAVVVKAGAADTFNNQVFSVLDNAGNLIFAAEPGNRILRVGNGYITPASQVALRLYSSLYGSTVGAGIRFGNLVGSRTSTSGANQFVSYSESFAPTSGTAVYSMMELNPTINQTGTANGVSRGLFVNPTVTAATDFRAIETVTGNVILGSTSGNVGIRTTSPQYPLAVNGVIQAKEVLVNTGWSDYVFDANYDLRPLAEVAAFVKQNHHLPDIPSAAEVQQKGVSLGEMQSKLLAKIEELTLHMIQADDSNKRLEKQNRQLQKRIARLELSAAK